MKKVLIYAGSLSVLLFACETKTETGALAGAGVGALAGGLIGGGATGAVIGGAVGAAGGALVGSALDAQDRENLQQNSPQTLSRIDQREQLTLEDIEEMSRNRISDKTIIEEINSTNSVFYLTSGDIVRLKKAGVSEKVIDYMIQTSKN